MKTSAIALLALAGSAAAFQAPTPLFRAGSAVPRSTSTLKMQETLKSIGGYDVETANRPIDPLGLAKWIPVEQLRAWEVTNGRVAMLATVGWVWPEMFGMFAADDVTSPHALDALLQTAPVAWAQIIGLCGIIEANKWRHEQSGSTEPFYDPCFAYKSYCNTPKKLAKIQLMELKNGRLAMLGWAGFMAHALIPGSIPGYPLPF